MKVVITLSLGLTFSFIFERLNAFEENKNELGILLKMDEFDRIETEKPFLTRSVMTKINDGFIFDLTKDHEDTHFMIKPDENFKYMEKKSMSVYNELIKLFRDQELISNFID